METYRKIWIETRAWFHIRSEISTSSCVYRTHGCLSFHDTRTRPFPQLTCRAWVLIQERETHGRCRKCWLSSSHQRAMAIYRTGTNVNAHTYFPLLLYSLSGGLGSRCNHVRTVNGTFLRFLFPRLVLLRILTGVDTRRLCRDTRASPPSHVDGNRTNNPG